MCRTGGDGLPPSPTDLAGTVFTGEPGRARDPRYLFQDSVKTVEDGISRVAQSVNSSQNTQE